MRPTKINLVFRATVLKTLVRVGSVFFGFFLRIEKLNYKDPNEKSGIFVKKKVEGRAVPIGRDRLPETQDFFSRPEHCTFKLQ